MRYTACATQRPADDTLMPGALYKCPLPSSFLFLSLPDEDVRSAQELDRPCVPCMLRAVLVASLVEKATLPASRAQRSIATRDPRRVEVYLRIASKLVRRH